MALNKDCNKTNIADADASNQVGLVVRIDGDSDNNLQALFDSVLKPGDSKRPLQVPFRMRKLPNSFFNPPLTGSKSPTVSHSRANSTDSAFSTDSQSNTCSENQNVHHTPAVAPSGLLISHSRAHSSPASLQQTYAGLNTQPAAATGTIAKNNCNPNANPQSQSDNSIQRIHMKQRSYDVISPIQLQNELGALPPGWEQAKTNDGQIYYLNHITKTTQWEDPRVPIQRQQHLTNRSVNPRSVSKDSAASTDSLGSLPEGWEQALTESGDVYFINHINRTTSWNDPRIPIYMQKPSSAARPEMNWMESKSIDKERDYLKARDSIQEQRSRLVHKLDLQMDPFLSGMPDHSRQESADSGLSLSSNNFSVTPDYLSQIGDSMDCISESGGDLNSVSGLESPDNLVSSLQLTDNLCNEMLNDVQSLVNPVSTKQDDIDWYKIN
ncbi:transcriptional coactivator yorkie isoform X1 [Episyrphus balteatus]|uniref:transcriptional coactivator yorkie isoform X1 n=1 Tax=Episyrphus balteatus TaxID=286459 RepID=UPI0024868352|nr:transcriptional coactivator yorkie isoform X1 [Episyrphus balteatus]